jgi:hypothetical protein
MLFVDRVQKYEQAVMTELSQTSSLKITKVVRPKKPPRSELIYLDRQNKEQKPRLAQWWKLKVHVERHFHRTSWAFPKGVSFLTWMSALRPFLSQRTLKEEIRDVILSLAQRGVIRPKGAEPLTESESRQIRRGLAGALGIASHMLDSVKDEIRVLQRTVVLEFYKEGKFNMPGNEAIADDRIDDADDNMIREMLMEMQGFGKPKEDEGEELMMLKKKQKKIMEKESRGRAVDDDYLAGPLSIDTYMCYRVRPVMEMLEKRANKRAITLAAIEIAIFIIQASGSVLGVFEYNEWVALTIAFAAVLQGFIEFMNLRNQVTSVNLALRDLTSLIVFWDSLSIVRRRTPGVKMQITKTTEEALLMVTEAHTTAASNAITSVGKQMAADVAEEDAEES